MVIALFHRILFRLRFKIIGRFLGVVRNLKWRLMGMKLGKNTFLPNVYVTWPHQIQIGSNSLIERGVYFKYVGIWSLGPSISISDNVFIGKDVEFNIKGKITIGSESLIASGAKFIDHDHGISLECDMRIQIGPTKPIEIGRNVWIGANVIVLKGVKISDGAVVAAGAVVLSSIPENEIWGGIPARKIGERSSHP